MTYQRPAPTSSDTHRPEHHVYLWCWWALLERCRQKGLALDAYDSEHLMAVPARAPMARLKALARQCVELEPEPGNGWVLQWFNPARPWAEQLDEGAHDALSLATCEAQAGLQEGWLSSPRGGISKEFIQFIVNLERFVAMRACTVLAGDIRIPHDQRLVWAVMADYPLVNFRYHNPPSPIFDALFYGGDQYPWYNIYWEYYIGCAQSDISWRADSGGGFFTPVNVDGPLSPGPVTLALQFKPKWDFGIAS